MKKILLLILLQSICASYGFSQQLDIQKIQSLTQNAIKKAYPASVRMWAFDTVKRQQAGPQFSGVVVTPEGHILTAAHVNTPGQSYLVTFPDGKTGIAKGLGKIEFAKTPNMPDVAMMKIITVGTWPYAEMGWSSAIKINEPVISISYPESLNQPLPLVRFGSITNVKNEYGFLQSTCMMEPGDSGGPIFDYLGRVIGLHSAINVDVDYEIPVDFYRKYWKALNVPRTYAELPEQEDAVGNDPEIILSIPALANLNSNFIKTAKQFSDHVVSINSMVDGKQQQVMGTLVKTEKGTCIISKSSLIGVDPVVRVANGKDLTAKVISRDRNTDLVLLQAGSKLKGGVSLNALNALNALDASVKDTIAVKQLGMFLISVQPGAGDSQVSVMGSTVFSLNKIAGMAYLGAAVAYTAPVAITVVQPGSPAGNAGLQIGDQLVSINDTAINKPEDYGNQLMKYWAGDTIQFDILREGSRLSKQIILASRPERPVTHPVDMFVGGKSSRRDGFDAVFAHGAKIRPEQCGGPVFDTAGHFYGINIARFGRASTIAIPAKTILAFIKTGLNSTQLP
ncbi:S1C family serine protease [Pedobacter psychroterrae]|uniref:Serine protease n=1 Tax=Pedobacter psychroterrae TaxID=2530453 RepID=A0A4R0NAZ0_9SPHI|nr:trypsin-like peptidase domain-containing protein [Pedobacter psychroterrae]TCC97418.1 serine protease [Pedobacter psychroterrae]